jgi:hypothetical protein
MERYTGHRRITRAAGLALGVAGAIVCAAPRTASASLIIHPHWGAMERPGDVISDAGLQDQSFTGFVGGEEGEGPGIGDANSPTLPVPEPGTLALLGAGMAGLLYVGLRRRSVRQHGQS